MSNTNKKHDSSIASKDGEATKNQIKELNDKLNSVVRKMNQIFKEFTNSKSTSHSIVYGKTKSQDVRQEQRQQKYPSNLMEMVQNNRRSPRSMKGTGWWINDFSSIGRIIGRGGSNLRRVQQITNTIVVQHKGTQLLYIYGYDDQSIQKAKEDIERLSTLSKLNGFFS